MKNDQPASFTDYSANTKRSQYLTIYSSEELFLVAVLTASCALLRIIDTSLLLLDFKVSCDDINSNLIEAGHGEWNRY